MEPPAKLYTKRDSQYIKTIANPFSSFSDLYSFNCVKWTAANLSTLQHPEIQLRTLTWQLPCARCLAD